MDLATNESGAKQNRLPLNPDLYTAIWWFADYPNHYAGEGAKATAELGKVITEAKIEALIKALKSVKADNKTLELQQQYFDQIKH